MALATRPQHPSLRSYSPAASPRRRADRPGVHPRPRSVRRSQRASRRQTLAESHPHRSINRRIVSIGMRRWSCNSLHRGCSIGSGVLEANLGLIDIKSHSISRSIVPAVSIVTCNPRLRSKRHSSADSFGNSGSPPVNTTCLQLRLGDQLQNRVEGKLRAFWVP